MDAALAAMLGQTVTLEPWASQDSKGQATYGAAVSHRAQVTHRQKMVRTTDGREVIATTQVILAGAVSVTTKARITLPASMTPTSPPILAVETFPDERGAVHTTVLYLGGSGAGRES